MKNYAKDLAFKFDSAGIKGTFVIKEISFEVKNEKKYFAIMDRLTTALESIFEVTPAKKE